MRLYKLDTYNKIYAVEDFMNEFDEVVSEKNATGRYHSWLRRKLSVLDASGYLISDRDFEPLDTNPRLYAIRYPKSPKNPRVIYAYIDHGKVCLLHTFKESSKQSGSDYRSAIKIATNRLKALEDADF